jgi:fibronectin-binding autotransporter adhesin
VDGKVVKAGRTRLAPQRVALTAARADARIATVFAMPELAGRAAFTKPAILRLAAVSVAALMLAMPAAADGGRGGGDGWTGGGGGAGGIDNPTGPGGAGADPTHGSAAGGGGGAGAGMGGAGGAFGGQGGAHGSVGAGLPVGNSSGTGGANGGGGGFRAGGGGGAGGYGAVVTGDGALGTLSSIITITGGNGGNGPGSTTDQGGSGGTGGVGLFLTDTTQDRSLTVSGTVNGGNGGGAGGSSGARAGDGGAGGAGIRAGNGGGRTTLVITGTVQAGNGGPTGPGFPAGTEGAAGAGITGSNLSITNSGTISAGVDGYANLGTAVHFTGGDNSLTFVNATSGLIGGIVVEAGTLTFAQPTNVTVDNVISGAGAVIKTGAGTLLLTGVNTYTGGTSFNGGDVWVSSDANLGDASGGLSFNGGTLTVVGGSFTSARAVTLNAGGGTIQVDGGRSLLLTGNITGTGGLTKSGGGELALQGNNDYFGNTLVQSGRLVASSSGAFSANSNYTIAAGATLEVSDAPGIRAMVGSLSGSGKVEIGSGATLVTGSTDTTATFSGTITGNGSFEFDGSGTQIISGSVNIGGDLFVCACGGNGQLVLRGGSSTIGGDIIVFGGTLAVEQGAALDNGLGFALSVGAIRVDGVGSSFNTGSLQIQGAGEAASLIVSGGATLNSVVAAVDGSVSTASATVTGTGSRWTISGGLLAVGASSSEAASVTVADGGVIDLNGGDLQLASLGTLNIGNGGRAGTVLAAGIVNEGRIVADFTDTATLGVVVSGSGSLTKRGGGTLILAATNSYSGGTTLEGGTISIASDGNLGDASGALTLNGGVLQVTGTGLTQLARDIVFGPKGGGFDIAAAANTFTVTQSFSGTGSLSKAGAGTLLLTNTHTYAGATTVSGGTLLAGRTGSFSPASAFTVAAGATLDLSGFSQSIGSLAGAGTVALGAGTLSTGSDNTSTTFSGVITGTGGLSKAGTGSLTLTGTSSYSGATTVQAGKLVVNGSLANSVVGIDAGATLGGSGTVGGIVAASGGTVAPGNSIGTLSVTGNVAFAAGSTYQVEVNAAGQGDRINATGIATLSGGTVQVLAESGNYAAATSYTILSANGGVTGQFAGVTSSLAFLTPTLVYDAQNVRLAMTRNDHSFGPDGGGGSGGGSGDNAGSRPYIAATRNQGFIGNAAERLGVGNPVYNTLISATAAEARAGFDLLSGEAHAQGVSVATAESRLVREAVLGRLRGTLLPGPGAEILAGFSADLPSAKGPVAMPAPRPGERFAIWGEAVGAHANSDGDGNAASLSRRTGGAILGADMKLYDSGAGSLRVGIAGGYTQSNFDVDGRLSSGRLESGHALLYAGARYGNWRLDGGIGYSFGETSLTRQVRIRGFGDSLRSDRDTDLLQGFAELGYAFRFERFALEPFAQLALLRASSGSAIEQGGAAALWVAAQDQTLGFATLGLRAEAQLGAMPLFARGLLGWRYGFGDLTPQATTGFASAAFVAGTPARVYAAEIDRNALVAEAGLDWRVGKATTLGLAYSAAIGERTRDHALKGRFEVRF